MKCADRGQGRYPRWGHELPDLPSPIASRQGRTVVIRASWLSRPGLRLSFVLAYIVLVRALIPPALYSAVLAVVTIAISTTLVKRGHRPVPAPAATPG